MFSQATGSFFLAGVDDIAAKRVLLSAIAVLLAYTLMWVVFVMLRYERREWLLRMCDPASHPGGSLLQALHQSALLRMGRRDHRLARCGDVIQSAGRRYEIVTQLSRGDLTGVHYALVANRPHVLKIIDDGRWTDLQTKEHLLAREQGILRRLRCRDSANAYGEYFPEPVELFRSAGRTVSTFRWRDGFVDAGEIGRRCPDGLDGRHIAWMFNRTLEALGWAHRNGWLHGAVLPPHLLFHGDTHGLQLIGWIHAQPIGSPLKLVARKYKAWYPPECQQRKPATPATDIYLAAKSMVWLAGGDPNAPQLPKNLPDSMIRLLQKCLLDSQSARPADAWALHEQFRELLQDTFGPAKFCHLQLS
jgi:hypothetical protein